MKMFRSAVLSVFLMVMGVAFAAQSDASAWSERIVTPSGDVRVNLSDKPNGSVYVYAPAGEAVITGKIKGDIYCLAERVVIDAEIDGSVNCASPNIVVKGEIDGGVRLATLEGEIEGRVSGDVSSVANALKISKTASIDGDLNGAISKLDVDGEVGSVLGSIGQLNINSQVGSIDVVAQSISLGSSARVEGDVNYQSSGRGEIKVNESRVDGDVNAIKGEEKNTTPLGDYLTGLAIITSIMLSLVAVTLAPFSRLFRKVSSVTVGKAPLALLIGFLALFAVPSLTMFIAITIVGLPLALAILMAWVALLMVSVGYTVFTIADALTRAQGKMSPMWSYVSAAVLLSVAVSLPLVGVAVVLMSLIYGSGSLLLAIFKYQFDGDSTENTKTKTKVKKTNKDKGRKD